MEELNRYESELQDAVNICAGEEGIADFLSVLDRLLTRARELVIRSPDDAEMIIGMVLRVYDGTVAHIPTGLSPVFDSLIKAQIRSGLEAILRQALSPEPA